MPSPSPPGDDSLAGVAATSARNAWAVGSQGNHTLILHWDGRAWKRARRPRIAGVLDSVAATSARNAWAVGAIGSKTLILHWNGRA